MRVKKLLCSILALAMILSTMGTVAFAEGTADVAFIGENGYATVAAAIDAAYSAGMKDVVITLKGDTNAGTTDCIDIYNQYGATAFANVTIRQEDPSKPFYLKNLYTGWRTAMDGKFVFDGVNIVVTTQFMAISNVELINNSTITRSSDVTNFVSFANLSIEPGSKFISLVDRVSSGSSVTVDGGRTDGAYNIAADYKTVWLYVEDGNTMNIKNGAYVVASNWEFAEMHIYGTVNMQASKLDVFTAIRIFDNGIFKLDSKSVVNTKSIIGTGKIVIDAENMTEGDFAALQNVNLSGFTGTVEVTNAEKLKGEIVDGKIRLVPKFVTGTWGGIDWTLTDDGTLTIAPTKSEPVADANCGKTYAVGAWREAVVYDSKGEGQSIGGWPYDRTKVKKLIIEEGVTSIGSFTAQGYTNLTGEVVIPSTVTYIGQEAFQKSTFASLVFAAGGTNELCIAQGAFKNLIIETVALPDDRPVHLHAWVFNNCHNLKSATLPATLNRVWGTNHIDYFKDFEAHSNPTWTTASEIFAYNENLETITFGSEAVRDMFFSYTNGTNKDYIIAYAGLEAYSDLQEAVSSATAPITLFKNVSDKNITVRDKNVTVVANNKARAATTLNNVIFTVENGASFSLDGFAVRGLSYIYAKTPESLSVTNCDINVTTKESPKTNTPPAFVLFSASQGGSVDFTFTGNTLLARPDETEAYTYSHGITGWNFIESATITNNTFGSADEPLSAAAVKLMNFVDGAAVEISNNTIYANSKDSTYGPNALQLYQCNSRDNKYTATISGNAIYVDDATAAIGVNSAGKGNGYVAVTADNTVNGQAVSISDVIVFGNGINDATAQGGYIGVGVEFDSAGKIIAGVFSEHSPALEAAVADGYAVEASLNGDLHVVSETLLVDEIKVDFVFDSENEEEKVYNINLTAGGDIINRLNSVDLTFDFDQISGENAYEIIASNSEVAINPVKNSKTRYEFHYNGKTDAKYDTNVTITIGQVKFTGYGKFSFAVDADANATNVAHATTLYDNLVDTFVPGGVLADGTEVGDFDITDDTISGIEIAVPTRELIINIDFPNAVAKKAAAYQQMEVKIEGGNVKKTLALGNANYTEDATAVLYPVAVTVGDGYVLTANLPYNTTYTVTVSGAGYRTATYSVVLTDDKELTFWNNVMDDMTAIEKDNANSETTTNFLAGDIVKDNKINVYDLSAVVSYFGKIELTNTPGGENFAKYDLDRDGKIDAKDVAYVLVSWGN